MKWDQATTAVRTSIDVKHPHARALLSQMIEVSDIDMKLIIGQTLEVTDFFAHVVELPAFDTGEIAPMIRLVLRLKDGRTTSTCSESFIKGFSVVANMIGAGPWLPPLLLRTRANKGRNGFNYYTCAELIRESDAESSNKPTSKKHA